MDYYDFLSSSGISDILFLRGTDEFFLISESVFEKKYLLIHNGKKFLLTIGNFKDNDYLNKARAYLKKIADFGVNSQRVLKFGLCDNGSKVYILFNWISGTKMAQVLLNQKREFCYNMGVDSGVLLKKIHSIKINDCSTEEDLFAKIEHLREKIDRYSENISAFENVHLFLDYLKHSTVPINDYSNSCLLHGDYSVNNLVVEKKRIYVIDWVGGVKGNIEKDFVRNLVNAQVNPSFAKGVINGYFKSTPSELFWENLLFYSVLHQLELIDWIGIFDFITEDFINKQHRFLMFQYNNLYRL